MPISLIYPFTTETILMAKRNRESGEILESIERLLIMFMVKKGINSDDIAKATGMSPRTIRDLYPKGGTYEKR